MSSSPLKPLGNPSRTSSRSLSTQSNVPPGNERLATSSASSSQTAGQQLSRADQIMYRFYLKTVGVLGEGRLTHYGSTVGKGTEEKKDKWFNLALPENDLHKSDLQIYRSISSYPILPPSPSDPGGSSVPPLLVAFILDTSDLPSGQALMWNRSGGRVRVDTSLSAGKGKGKEAERKSGIVLERWTFQAALSPSSSSTQLPPHTAYRHGIIHFRALFALIRLLPAYRLHRKLRRANNGLRLGIKLWGPEGYPNSAKGLEEAWEIMERGLIGLDEGLDTLVAGETNDEEDMERHDFPPLDLFGYSYNLGVEYRTEIDFQVEDMESVLSEKFVDMDEDWFKPTVARHRLDSEAALAAAVPVPNSLSSSNRSGRGIATSIGIPSNASPIPLRQQAAPIGSFASGGEARLSGSRVSSGLTVQGSSQKKNVGSLGTDKWGLLAEGLPFASGMSGLAGDSKEPTSPTASSNPSGAMITARRLSAHSIHPFRSSLALSSSPSTSILRGTPPSASPMMRPPTGSQPSSIGRTSSFLIQSGRSFTHAQMANMVNNSQETSPPVGSLSNRNLWASSPPPQSPASPSSLSFTKQTFPRSLSGRPQLYTTSTGSSPFIPSSYERESPILSPGQGALATHGLKRHSSSLSQRNVLSGSGNSLGILAGTSGSAGSSGDGRSIPGSAGGQGLLRRTSTRESTLRHSLEGNRQTLQPPPDEDEIQAFLKSLDTIPQPPSLTTQLTQSKPNLRSTSSSLSATSIPPSPSPATDQNSPNPHSRVPLSRAQVDEALKKMVGSFNANFKVALPDLGNSGLMSSSQSRSRIVSESSSPGGYGLLSASRPSSSVSRVSSSETPPVPPTLRRTPSGNTNHALLPRAASVKTGSPLSSAPMQPPPPPQQRSQPPTSQGSTKPFPVLTPTSHTQGTARSLPPGGSHSLIEDGSLPTHSPSGGYDFNLLSPQTTGGLGLEGRSPSGNNNTNNSNNGRRGPVLLRGGFGAGIQKSSSSSPSHSPIRDFARMQRDREREKEKEKEGRGGNGVVDKPRSEDTWNRASSTAPTSFPTSTNPNFNPSLSNSPLPSPLTSAYKSSPSRPSLSSIAAGLQSPNHGPVLDYGTNTGLSGGAVTTGSLGSSSRRRVNVLDDKEAGRRDRSRGRVGDRVERDLKLENQDLEFEGA